MDKEEMTAQLIILDDEAKSAVESQIKIVWPISHSLCGNLVAQAAKILRCLSPAQFEDWTRELLACYEKEGLKRANAMIASGGHDHICMAAGERGLELAEIKGLLEYFLAALTRNPPVILAGDVATTDTAEIILPQVINQAGERERNLVLYKLVLLIQWGYLKNSTLFPIIPDTASAQTDNEGSALAALCAGKDNPALALTLYQLLETARVSTLLRELFPGLFHQLEDIIAPERIKDQHAAWLYDLCLGRKTVTSGKYGKVARLVIPPGKSPEDSVARLNDLYQITETMADEIRLPWFAGVLRPNDAARARKMRREKTEKKFINLLACRLAAAANQEGQDEEEGEANTPIGGDSAIMPPENSSKSSSLESDANGNRYLNLGNKKLILDLELSAIAREIESDLGGVPQSYISGAMSGVGGVPQWEDDGGEYRGNKDDVADYDEWDYRRRGFRRDWCRLVKRELRPVCSNLVRNTLENKRGLLIRLRKSFEAMRAQEKWQRRQNDGDEIDLEAVIEARADLAARLQPRDGMYRRNLRDERDTEALFLIDMSSSTEGWVGQIIRESLILLVEAMECLGDTYSIYGFSGMRRLRCDFFHIKHPLEPCSEDVRNRIAAISPMEYTRMGPAIRHASSILAESEARHRVLFIISDGKPEDYDDYKGEYAIQDTRHALIEAKSAGIYPFCVTVDREASSYIARMYGEVNYAIISECAHLPEKIPEIYRSLTS